MLMARCTASLRESSHELFRTVFEEKKENAFVFFGQYDPPRVTSRFIDPFGIKCRSIERQDQQPSALRIDLRYPELQTQRRCLHGSRQGRKRLRGKSTQSRGLFRDCESDESAFAGLRDEGNLIESRLQ